MGDARIIEGALWLMPNHIGGHENAPLLPKLSLGMQVTIKLRAGELTADDLARLEVLNLGPIELEVIPAWFIEQFERNRPELVACNARVNYVHSWCRISPDSIKAIRPIR